MVEERKRILDQQVERLHQTNLKNIEQLTYFLTPIAESISKLIVAVQKEVTTVQEKQASFMETTNKATKNMQHQETVLKEMKDTAYNLKRTTLLAAIILGILSNLLSFLLIYYKFLR